MVLKVNFAYICLIISKNCKQISDFFSQDWVADIFFSGLSGFTVTAGVLTLVTFFHCGVTYEPVAVGFEYVITSFTVFGNEPRPLLRNTFELIRDWPAMCTNKEVC